MDAKDSRLALVENFERYFRVELAQTAQQKHEIYAVRYRVYCEEFQYLSLDKFDQSLEYDAYDQYAQLCLIRHLETQLVAGCVRLVPTFDECAIDPLPFEKYCGSSLDNAFIASLRLERPSICEISRLAVDRVFRKRSGETLTRFGELNAFQFSPQEQRTFSLIAVACFLSATFLTESSCRTNVFAMMEPFLPRMLQHSGIFFQRAGRDIDYHGIRAPYFITTQSVLNNIHPELRELYHWIRSTVS